MARRLWWAAVAVALVGAGPTVLSAGIAEAAPDPVAVYDSIGIAPGNVASVGFEATSTSEFGDRVQIGPGPRQLASVTVLMSSWACESGGWTGPTPCASNPGATFTHPLTLTLYADNGSGVPAGVLTTMTMDATIPYRPSADTVNCTGGRWFDGTNCYNGYAVPITFDFPAGTVLPSRLIWGIAYDTTHHGYNPIGAAACGTNCPYDSLNVGAATSTPSPSRGTDVDPSGVFMNTSGASFYCDGGAGGVGILRLDNGCWASNRPMAIIKTQPLSETVSTVVVRASTPTWGFFTENTVGGQTGVYAPGPVAAPLGTGSAQIGLTAANQGMALGTLDFAGTPLAELTNLGYSSYQAGSPQAISLQFDINYHGPGDVVYAGRLVYEPYQTETVSPNLWQSWNALNGTWWASRTGNPGSGGLCGQPTPCTWAQVMTNWPDATIRGTLLFKAGSGWTSFDGAVDALTVGVDDGLGNLTNTTFDFEPTPQCTTVCHVDATTGNDLNGGTTATDAKRSIQAGVDQVSTGGTVLVAAGTYGEDVAVNKSVTVQGAGSGLSTVVGQSGGSHATFFVTAADVVIDGFTITRAGNALATWNDPLNTAGVSINASGRAEIRNNTLTGNRTAIDINNSVGNVVRNNVINDNRTGVILWNTTDNTVVTENRITNNWTLGILFLDGSGGTNVPPQRSLGSSFMNNDVSGNWFGGIVDRQSGGSLPVPGNNLKDFSGNWFGTTAPVFATVNSVEPGYAALIPVEFGGSAVPPGGSPDVLGAGVANIDFTPFLDSGTDTSAALGFQGSHAALAVTVLGAQTGSASRLQEGVDLVDATGVVRATAGEYPAAVPVQIDKSLSLVGPNVGVSPNAPASPDAPNPARVAEATVAIAGGNEGIRIAAPNVVVEGLRLTDAGTAGASTVPIIGAGGSFGGSAAGITVRNNLFDAPSRIAVELDGPTSSNGGTVSNNRVADPSRAAGCGSAPSAAPASCVHHLFTLLETDHLSFTGNAVISAATDGDGVGVLRVGFAVAPSAQDDAPAANVTVKGNTIRNSCSAACFEFDQGVTNLVISDNDVSVATGPAVELGPSWSGGTVAVGHNRLNGVNEAVVVIDNSSADLARVTVTRNAITAFGIRNDVNSGNLDARCNWWGSSSGAAPAQISGNVTVTGPLGSADLNGPCVEPRQLTAVTPEEPARLADFIPVSPTRLFDTRPDSPPSLRVVDTVKVGGANVLEVKVTDLVGLVPASGVGAVSLNVTAVDPDADGFVTVYPCGARPLASNVDYRTGQTVPNAVIAPVSASGTVCFYSLRLAHLVVDINGWFRAGGGYTPVGPRRVFDTRPKQGPDALRPIPTTKLVAGTELRVQLSDLGEVVPASGVAAVSLNVTVVDAMQRGFLSVYPCAGRPLVSSVNYEIGETVANEVIAVLSPTGSVCFFASATVDLVVDVNGWLASVSDFHKSGPARVLDTRPGESANALVEVSAVPIEPGVILQVDVANLGGVVPPSGVSAVSLNVTATNITTPGFITVFPCGPLPLVSSVNYAAPNLSTANAVLVPVSAIGTVCFYSMAPVDLVVDINGWFATVG